MKKHNFALSFKIKNIITTNLPASGIEGVEA